jgi:hypothetical protein
VEAVEALLLILEEELRLPTEYHLELITHPVGTNWRERYRSPPSQILAIGESLIQSGPFEGELVRLADLAVVLTALRMSASRGRALSMTSRVYDGQCVFAGHLAMMNLHPVGFTSADELCRALHAVCKDFPGLLLCSGRFYHYYGFRLLDQPSWLQFLAQLLMPCTLVSPRYIGHSLYRGFCSLRLNRVAPHKSVVPHVVGRVGT